jgi:FkbM family methyltransferase
MSILKSISNYTFYYRKYGKGGLQLYSNINRKANDIFEVRIKDILHPFYLRGNSTDIHVFEQVFAFKQYKISYNFKPEYIFDLGANTGLASVYFKNVYPDATIIAVEPDPKNFEILLKNTAAYKNIHCYMGGIWNKTTALEIIDTGKGEWAYITKEVSVASESTIDAVTIDTLMHQYNIPKIDILKLDIESAEKEVFEGEHQKWMPKVKAMIIELHDRYKPGCSESFFKAMSNYKFSTRLRGENIICDMNF